MSAGLTGAEAALYGGLGGGLIGGVFALLGVAVERLLRQTGRLHFEAPSRSLRLAVGEDDMGRPLTEDWRAVEVGVDGEIASYIFHIDLFNGKEVPTGLRDMRVELTRNDGERLKGQPQPMGPPESRLQEVINFSPRQFKHLELYGFFGGEAAEAIRDRRWRSIDFVGDFPRRPILGILGSKTYRKTILQP